MASTKKIKVALLGTTLLLFVFWLSSSALTNVMGTRAASSGILDTESNVLLADDDYVGSETCKACHEDQFNAFAKTKHASLPDIKSWMGKAHGCESCHGSGKTHVEDPTVKGSIISFKNKDAKAVSETCLTCHAGRESHNEFRRGEHWRNNVGCTDCHTPHGPGKENLKAGSITFVGPANAQRANQADAAMLKQSEPQLCMTCHNETKAQFSKPFHHKVLEGTMSCSDCHNAHGGFEAKQTKLAVGVDAACIKCHANKQGPFVYEHAPLKLEGCASCHNTHGSANPKMLKRASVKQLCMECHSSITDSLAPDVPSFHNQATVRYQDCTVCHAAIHGSNTSATFFR
jgi:predicted CXXCH cytochrome family protein